MSALLHIASFVVQHHPQATAALDAALATLPDTELALRDHGRSIVLCESTEARALLDRIETLRELPGVVGVNLVHHHAEDRARLLEEIDDDHPP
jgi:periplasmic nitrate reductase NapD